MTFGPVHDLLVDAHHAGIFPAAVVEVGSVDGPRWTDAVGRLSTQAAAPHADPDTVFDLASLTKVIATTSIAMRLVDAGRLSLETPLGAVLSPWRARHSDDVRIRHLLDHSSGLPAHARLWEQARGRPAYEAALTALPLASPPGLKSVYSDPGFMLLGFALEDLAGVPLDRQFAALAAEEFPGLRFGPLGDTRNVAPTENDPWRGRVLIGEVHDENAAALDGIAGHAGLFGNAADVGQFARLVLRTFRATTRLGSADLMRAFARPTGVPGSSRALGWDTMRPTSSCGTRMSASAIGHTGFTGTSLWIDHDHDRYVVLLSNRVHPTRANDAFVALRPRLHDAIADAWGGG